jgi:hypothetical protein
MFPERKYVGGFFHFLPLSAFLYYNGFRAHNQARIFPGAYPALNELIIALSLY